MRLGVVVALAAEARVLVPRGRLELGRTMQLSPKIGLRLCGMGPERATGAAQALLAEGANALLTFGAAGALDRGLNGGTLLLPEVIRFGDARLATHTPWRERVFRCLLATQPVVAGILLTSRDTIATAAEKTQLQRETSCAAVDMESGAVMQTAAAAGVPGLVMRAVADPAERDLPALALRTVDAYGRPVAWRLIPGLLRQPWELPALLRLGTEFRASLWALREAWRSLGPEGLLP